MASPFGAMFPFFFVLGTLVMQSNAQGAGEVCGCTPSFWEFVLDFSLPCDDNAFNSTGILDQPCEIRNLADGTDESFVGTVSIGIVELDQMLSDGFQEIKTDVANGQSFTFRSILSEPENVSEASIPSAIVVTINGQNAAGDSLRATWSLRFTNSCLVYPVVAGGERTGLTFVSQVTSPPTSFCPLAPEVVPTILPTGSPTANPTMEPSGIPSTAPTSLPSSTPSASPTANPSVAPSEVPSLFPTASGSVAPSLNPTASGSVAPSLNPTDFPSSSPTKAPVVVVVPTVAPTRITTASPSVAPSLNPTDLPSSPPTKAPVIVVVPTVAPTRITTASPSVAPSLNPTDFPSSSPTKVPVVVVVPTVAPTNNPTVTPSSAPTESLTERDTPGPAESATEEPTATLTVGPTVTPTEQPTVFPSDLCGCQPSFWEFLLDFGLPCPVGNAFGPQGILDETCSLINLSQDGQEDKFAVVDTIQILELNLIFQPINQETKTNLMDGDTFTFQSALANLTTISPLTLPSVILVIINGTSFSNQVLRATWSLRFSNSCEVFPVVEGGEKTILTAVTHITDPPQATCPRTPSPATVVPTPKPVPRTEASTLKPVPDIACPPVRDHGKRKAGRRSSEKRRRKKFHQYHRSTRQYDVNSPTDAERTIPVLGKSLAMSRSKTSNSQPRRVHAYNAESRALKRQAITEKKIRGDRGARKSTSKSSWKNRVGRRGVRRARKRKNRLGRRGDRGARQSISKSSRKNRLGRPPMALPTSCPDS